MKKAIALLVALVLAVGIVVVMNRNSAPTPLDASVAKETAVPQTKAPPSDVSAVEGPRTTFAEPTDATRPSVPALSDGKAFAFYGIVKSVAGEPLLGAVVHVHAGPGELTKVSTDEKGEYVAELDERPAGRILLRAGHPGYVSVGENLTVTQTATSKRHDFSLKPASALAGTVVDDEGAPLAGVEVTVAGSLLTSVETDETGKFAIVDAAAGENRIVFTKQGYMTVTERLLAPREDHVITMSNKGSTVSGRVTYLGSGLPVAGATVNLSSTDYQRHYHTSAVADQDGRYRMGPLPNGQFQLSAASEGMYNSQDDPTAVVSLSEITQLENNDLQIFSGYAVSGKVLLTGENTPLAGIRVSVPGSRGKVEVVSDEEGNYRLEGFFSRNIQVSAEGDGYYLLLNRQPRQVWGVSPTLNVQVPADKLETTADVMMGKAITISGRVVDEQKNPIVNAGLTFLSASSAMTTLRDEPTDRAGIDGAFSLSVEPFVSGSIIVTAENLYEASSDLIDVKDVSIDNIEIVMARPGVIAGVVVDPTDTPVEGATVSLSQNMALAENHNFRKSVGSVVTDGAGRFHFDKVPPRNLNLVASKDASFAQSETLSILLSGAEVRSDIRLQLRESITVAGRVVNEQAEPIPGIRINISGRDFHSPGVSTDDGGRFELKGVPPGSYTVGAHGNGVNKWVENVPGGKMDLEIVLSEESMTLVGYVVDRTTRKPIAEGTVTLNHPRPTSIPIKDGTFEIPDLNPAFAYQFVISAEGYISSTQQEYDLPKEKRVERKYELSKGGSVTGRVVDRTTGEPVESVSVTYLVNTWGGPDDTTPRGTTTADGRFLIEGVPGGRGNLEFTPPEPYTVRRAYFTGEDGTTADMGDVPLSSGATITVTVREMPGDVPAADRVVNLEGRGRGASNKTLKTDAEGRAVFTNIATGTYSVRSGDAMVTVEQLRDDDQREVDLRLSSAVFRGRLLREGEPLQGSITFTSIRNGTAISRHAGSNPTTGAFEVVGVYPGQWNVNIEPAGTQGARWVPYETDVTVVAGQEQDILYPASELTLMIEDQEGAPVPEADVIVKASGSRGSFSTGNQKADSQGRYVIRGLKGGEFDLIARKEGMLTETLTMDVPQEAEISVTISLMEAGTGTLESIALRLTDGEPIPQAWCRVYTAEGIDIAPNSNNRRDNRGVLRHANLPVGKYRTEVSHWGHSEAYNEIEIKEGETTVIEDVLYEAGSFRWIIHDKDGAPVAGARCNIRPVDRSSIERVRTGTTNNLGYFDQRGFLPGEYVAEAVLPDGKVLHQTFDILAHEHTEKTTSTEGAGIIHGSDPWRVKQ